MIGPLVHDLLSDSAQRRPESFLVLDGSVRASYGEIEASSNRIARVLLEQGIARGDRVGLIADNSRTYVESYYGILKAGGVVVSLGSAAHPATQAAMLRDCTARALICGPRQSKAVAAIAPLGLVDFVLGSIPDAGDLSVAPSGCRLLESASALAAVDATSPAVPMIDLDRAAILYTSGSTGRPRGVVLRHANIVANTRSIVQYLDLTANDRIFVVLPFHYVYGKSLLNTHVAVGGSVVLENRFAFVQAALDHLERCEATGFAGVPSTFSILLNKSNLAERSLPRLRYVTQAGGAMAPATTRRLMAALPGKRIFIMYGATEASARLSYLDPEDLPRKVGSIGKAIPNVELRVLREDGSEADAGEVGEIVARGSNIMEGIWGEPEGTAAVLDQHGFHTGDLGLRDEEGFLYVVGRKNEMIKSAGHRVSPKEIEEVLAESPAVDEAAVVGIADEILGEAVVAFVTLRSGDSDGQAGELQRWCGERLPSYKVPCRIEVVPELPRNPSGKIDRLALRTLASKPEKRPILSTSTPCSHPPA